MLPDAATFQFTPDLEICRLLNGLWQVSGGHGPIDPEMAVAAMFPYMAEGFTTWDLADHYGPAEDFVGEFRRQLTAKSSADAPAKMQAFTKWVPRPGPMTRPVVENAVEVSLRRMDVQCLDMLQFHWWDYQNPGYLDALSHLEDLRGEGRIKHVALTNFDTEHMKRIVDHGIRIVSNQVQFSLVDRRPEVQMAQFCQDQNIHLLAYGALCGGLLSDKYLGQPEPGRASLNTASLSKYKQMTGQVGQWGESLCCWDSSLIFAVLLGSFGPMKTAFLFTGQGSQFAGMGKDLAEQHSVARDTLAEADAVLGFGLSQLCFQGDKPISVTSRVIGPPRAFEFISPIRDTSNRVSQPSTCTRPSISASTRS